jgi:homoserine O-acetyltransferase/O-succinyltransferase
MTAMPETPEFFELGQLTLQSGQRLEAARLGFVTRGRLNAARDNAVLFPTYYGGTHVDNLALVATGRALDPERYFVVIPNLFGNGVSSSPSNHATQGAARFPHVTLLDNVAAQQRLLQERWGIERLALAFGWSMGAQQAYHHAALFPERVERLLVVCGSARTSPHNWVFLEGVKAALLADPAFAGGSYAHPPRAGLAAFARVYAGWAYSQAFFREGLYRSLGHATPEALLQAWEREHQQYDANDLLCVLRTWQHANIAESPSYGGDFAKALAAITARAIIMPCSTDLYFPVEDNRLEVAQLRRGELRVLDSPYGHVAGGPDRIAQATSIIEAALRELLAS